MDGGRGWRRGVLLAAIGVLAVLGVSCGSGPSGGDSGGQTTLVVHGAGTLAVPFKQVIAAFEQENPGVVVQSRFAGSVEMVRGVTELGQPVDVLGMADYSLIPSQMFGANGKRRFADWYVGFASNEITFAYTDKSKGAAQLTAQNWPQVLSGPGVRIGRSNPDTDPSGYQILQMLQLAQGYYHDPNLSAKVLANSPPGTLVSTETQLLPALMSGQIDYLGIYRSDALQHQLKYLELPPQINLSDPALAPLYESASVPTKSRTRTGKPIIYGLTVPTNAPNAALGEKFVAFVLGPQGQQIMRDNGFVVRSPALAGGAPPPAGLRPLTVPNALPTR